MKKNRAFVNLFLTEGVQKSPIERRHPRKKSNDLLYFRPLAWKHRAGVSVFTPL